MSYLVVVLLSLLWLGFFLPGLLEARRTSSPYSSASTFQASLRRLGEAPGQGRAAEAGPHPRHPTRPVTARSAVAARRRDTLAVLIAVLLAAVIIAVGFGGWTVWGVVPPSVALTAYVAVLRRAAVRRRARGRSVAGLQVSRSAPDPGPAAGAGGEPLIVPSVRRRSLPPTEPERIAG